MRCLCVGAFSGQKYCCVRVWWKYFLLVQYWCAFFLHVVWSTKNFLCLGIGVFGYV